MIFLMMLAETITEIRVHTIDAAHCVAQWDRVLIQLWRGEITRRAAGNLEDIYRAAIARNSTRLSSLAVVEGTSPPPTDVVRTVLADFYAEFGPQLAETLVVAEGSGFRSAIVRGVGLTLSALAPKKIPFRFVGTLHDAARILEAELGPKGGGYDGVLAAVEATRARIADLT